MHPLILNNNRCIYDHLKKLKFNIKDFSKFFYLARFNTFNLFSIESQTCILMLIWVKKF